MSIIVNDPTMTARKYVVYVFRFSISMPKYQF